MVRVVLTGGSGDLGRVLAQRLHARGDAPACYDPRPPAVDAGSWIAGDVRDRAALRVALTGGDCVVHLAAWHGIHEARGERDADDFWDLNVTGTFNVFEAAARAGIGRVVFLSSTSVRVTPRWRSLMRRRLLSLKTFQKDTARAQKEITMAKELPLIGTSPAVAHATELAAPA